MIKEDLLAMFKAALSAVDGEHVVKKHLPSILKQQLSADEINTLQIIAIGKAADAMLQGALNSLEEEAITPPASLLITKTDHISFESHQNANIYCIESAHPVPDESSLFAGQVLVEFLQSSNAPCLFLISGGTSSLVEMLVDNWSLKELQELTQWMLANACSINQINTVRSSISQLKGGGLWQAIQAANDQKKSDARKVICLMISDVPGDDPSVIGSGLLFPSNITQTVAEFLPDKWKHRLPPSVEFNTPAAAAFYWKIVASNYHARLAAANHAQELGYQTQVIEELLQDDAIKAAKHCVQHSKDSMNTLIIWGAETTVTLPDNPGKGGRNQHLALAAAIEMHQRRDNPVLLSAGTDGTDGLTEETGAIVDSGSVDRASMDGFDANNSLQQADSGHFLQASGDLISTGVTGTNVMDLIIAYCGKIDK